MVTKDTSVRQIGQGPASIRRVLVVDDSELQRRIVSASLRRWGLEVIEADSAELALDICRARRPDLVLSDWMMPGMSGLDFCRAFRDLPAQDYGYFILLSAKREKVEVAEGLDAGADDFLTKPVSPNELRARIAAGDRIVAMQRELAEKNAMIGDTLARLQEVYNSIDRDLKQARKIQQSMIPQRMKRFGASEVSLLLKPCGHIGGDMVGMFAADERHIAIYSMDVSGHGITSAMMSARIGGYLSPTYADQNLGLRRGPDGAFILRPPVEVVETLNARLMADAGIDEYFTIAYATIDLDTGEVRLVQAGHPHPLILRADGTEQFIGEGGLPVGLLEEARYVEYRARLEQGDKLLLYSDGFTEFRLGSGDMLNREGVIGLIDRSGRGQSGQEFLEDLFWNLTALMPPNAAMEDDVSATLFEYGGP